MKRNKHSINQQEALKQLERGYTQAQKVLEDEDKLERFLQRLETKMRAIPVAGEKLANLPILASLVKSYVKKEYTQIPLGTMIAVVSALVYFVSPVDLIPDAIPGVGHIDDAAVIAVCWELVESDVQEFQKWRAETGREIQL
ncbi:MAG: DUF1232 domain-containing protein [Oscillospiraceae bacterium]|nr:DUF1232 domain-containing protein [Oscillospiraceae bacterium]